MAKEVCEGSRFTALIYDKELGEQQWKLRHKFLDIEKFIQGNWEEPRRDGFGLSHFEELQAYCNTHYAGRVSGLGHQAIESAKAVFLAKDSMDICLIGLEAAYMWYGKSIRDEAIKRGCPVAQP